MNKSLIALLSLLIPVSAFASPATPVCYQTAPGVCSTVATGNGLPISIYDSGNHSGYCYTSNGSGSPATFQACGGGGGGSPGGSQYNVQLNNGSSGFAGSSSLTSDSSNDLFIGGVVGIGTSSETSGVSLDLGSETNSLLLPSGTSAQRPTGVAGMIRYNSTATPTFEGYVNGVWQSLTGLVGDATYTANHTIAQADMGAQANYNGSSITATIPAISTTVFPANAYTTIVNTNSSALTLSTTPTINGFPGTSLGQYGWISLLSNGTSLDAFGFPGFGTITSSALEKFSGTTGISTASSITDNGTTIDLGSVATVTESNGNATFGAISVSSCSGCGSSSNINLGTSASATNPQRTSQAGTGFYSDTTNEVEVAISGSNLITWSAATEAIAGILVSTPSTLSISTSTFTPTATGSNTFRVVLVHASCPCTIANPSGTLVDGTKYLLEIWQSSSGSDTIGTWGSSYDFGTAGAPTLSTSANKGDLLGFEYSAQNSKMNYLGIQQGM